MSIRIVRWESLSATPWKNGGGTAVDLVVSPEDASVDDFEWRINIATIARSGPFSNYPEIDRDFRVLDGGELELDVDGTRQLLVAGGASCRFPGDRPTYARLLDESIPCRAFNVLTRRGLFTCDVSELVIGMTEHLDPGTDVLAGIVRSGSVEVTMGTEPERLGSLDTFVAFEPVTLQADAQATVLLVRISTT